MRCWWCERSRVRRRTDCHFMNCSKPRAYRRSIFQAYYICLSNKAGWFPRSSMAFSRRSGFGTCANKLKRPLDCDTSLFHTLSRQTTVALLFSSPDFLSRKWCVRLASGDLLPPSAPAEKATARQDQPWKSCADDGGGDCQEYPPRCGHDLSGEQNSYFDCY